jgi:hypothetical protein
VTSDAKERQAVAAPAPEASNVAGGASNEREAAPPAPPSADDAAAKWVQRGADALKPPLGYFWQTQRALRGKLDGEDG